MNNEEARKLIEKYQLEAGEAHTVLHPTYDWDYWFIDALKADVPKDLASLGREVMREFYQHQWSNDYADEVGPDAGKKMIRLALEHPQKASKRWRYLLQTDGERYFEE
jgi:hypothetical protein